MILRSCILAAALLPVWADDARAACPAADPEGLRTCVADLEGKLDEARAAIGAAWLDGARTACEVASVVEGDIPRSIAKRASAAALGKADCKIELVHVPLIVTNDLFRSISGGFSGSSMMQLPDGKWLLPVELPGFTGDAGILRQLENGAPLAIAPQMPAMR